MTELEKLNVMLHLSKMREHLINMQTIVLDQASDIRELRNDIEMLAREINSRPEEGDQSQPESN